MVRELVNKEEVVQMLAEENRGLRKYIDDLKSEIINLGGEVPTQFCPNLPESDEIPGEDANSNPTPTSNTSENVAHGKSEEHGEGGGVAPSAKPRPTLSTSQQHLQTENEKCYFCRHLSYHRGNAGAYTPQKFAPSTAETHFEMQTADWPPHESLEYPAPKDHTLSSCGRSRSWPSAVQSWLPLQRGVINVRDATPRAEYRQTRAAATATPSASAAAGLPGGDLTTPRSVSGSFRREMEDLLEGFPQGGRDVQPITPLHEAKKKAASMFSQQSISFLDSIVSGLTMVGDCFANVRAMCLEGMPSTPFTSRQAHPSPLGTPGLISTDYTHKPTHPHTYTQPHVYTCIYMTLAGSKNALKSAASADACRC